MSQAVMLREQVEYLQAEVAASRCAREELAQLRLFQRHTSELFWTMDLQGNFTYMSPAVEYLWGYKREEIMGLTLTDVLTPASLAIAIEANRRFFAEIKAGHPPKSFRAELEHLCKDGSIVWAEVNVNYIFDEEGVFLEKRGITRDITERKRHELLLESARMAAESARQALEGEVSVRRSAEELLMMHQRELELLNLELELRVAHEVKQNRKRDQVALIQIEKMASVGQLAAGVAHEINNPIGYVSSNLQILAEYFQEIASFDRLIQESVDDDSLPNRREMILEGRAALKIDTVIEDGVDLINESLEGVQRVTEIVRNLKRFSRIDTGESTARESVTLDSCLERALNICRNELKYVATIRKEYEKIPAVLCHPGQLNQVFLNLLVNAAQAITAQGEIFLRCWEDAGTVSASIRDTGNGMSEELMARIFEPFFTTKDPEKGTGLGLSISSEIIERHQGTLRVSSTVGVGTTFTVTLPKAVEI